MKRVIIVLVFLLCTWQKLSAQCLLTVKAEGVEFVTITNLATKETVQIKKDVAFTLNENWQNELLLFSALGKKDTIVNGFCGLQINLRDEAVLQKTVTVSTNEKFFKEVIDNSDIKNLYAEGFYTVEIEEVGNPYKRCEVVNASIAHIFSSNKRLISAIQRVGIDSCKFCYEQSFYNQGRINMSSNLNEYQPSYWFSDDKIKSKYFIRLQEVKVLDNIYIAYLNDSYSKSKEICLVDTVKNIIVSCINIHNDIKGEHSIGFFGSFLSKSYFIGKVVNDKLEPMYIGKKAFTDRAKGKIHTYNFHFYRYNTPMKKSSLRLPLFGLEYWGEGIEPRFKNLSCKTDCNVSIDAKPPKPTYISEEERLAYIKVLDELAAKYITINWEIKKPVSGVNWDFK